MQKIDQLKSDIAHTIKESAEYKEYKRLEAVVNMDPNLKRSGMGRAGKANKE